jgi:TRAP transporter 4TM/12TM fusion protein
MGSLKVKKFLDLLALASMLYLVIVGVGAYHIILSVISHYVPVPESLILTSQHSMSLFLSIALLYVFLTTPARKGGKVGLLDYLLAVVSFVAAFYRFLIYNELSVRIGITTTLDVFFGVLTVALLIEAVRRKVGLALAVITASFALFGLWDAGFDVKVFVERLYLFNVGIYSTPLEVAVSMIAVFLLFGSFLEASGVSDYFTRLALALVGDKRGGPAKVTVAASALLGTTTGSATGDTAVIGSFTIPAMRRTGLSAEAAAAIAAACGTGAQIVPPILGSAAFIMPLYLGLTYWHVVLASIVPAILYYTYLLLYTDLQAIKYGLRGLPKEELPADKSFIIKEVYLFLPLVLLVSLLASGFEAETAALSALTLAILIIAYRLRRVVGLVLGASIAVLLAVLSTSLGSAISAIFLVSALSVLVALSLRSRGTHDSISSKSEEAMIKAFKESVSIILTCAAAGVVAGVLSLSGLSYQLGRIIWDVSGGNLVAVLLMVMLIAILLGFGLPTPVVYIMTVSILGPLAVFLKIPPIALHYFIFYYGIFAPLTPPVALASYAAASIAKADFWRTGLEAFTMTLGAWLIAWAFALEPSMLLVPVSSFDVGTVARIAVSVLVTIVGELSVLISYTGAVWRVGKIGAVTRVLYVAVAILAIASLAYKDLIPVVFAVFLLLLASTTLKGFRRGAAALSRGDIGAQKV